MTTEARFYKRGDKVLFRSVTGYQLGEIAKIGKSNIVLKAGGGWVADTGRFAQALEKGPSSINEFERSPVAFGVAKGAIVDWFFWPHELPTATR